MLYVAAVVVVVVVVVVVAVVDNDVDVDVVVLVLLLVFDVANMFLLYGSLCCCDMFVRTEQDI